MTEFRGGDNVEYNGPAIRESNQGRVVNFQILGDKYFYRIEWNLPADPPETWEWGKDLKYV